MNKKTILKEQKRLKEERRQAERMFADDKEIYNVFKIGLGVIAFILLSFAVINIANGNWNLFNRKNDLVEEIDNKMVIAGTMFNKEDKEYLVLAYDMKASNKDFYSVLTDGYSGTTNLYYLDLSSGFNRDYIGNKTIISNDLSQLKFSGPTLLLINKDKIVKSYTGEQNIVNYFNNK